MRHVRFETMQGRPEQVTSALNEFREFCNEIKFHSCQLVLDQLQQPAYLALIELHFKGDGSLKEFDSKYSNNRTSSLLK